MEDLKEQIKEAYEHGEGSFQQLADKYNVKVGTIKSWSKRDKDEGNQWIKVATKKKKAKNQSKNATKKKEVASKVENISSEEEKNIQKENSKKFKDAVEKVSNNDELTDKEKMFCYYYVKCWNKGKAAQKAGYVRNYPNGIYEVGHELYKKPQVRTEIERLKAQIRDGIGLEAEAILQKICDIAFANITDYVEFGQKEITKVNEDTGEEQNFKYNYVDFKESNKVDGSLISEVKQGKDGVSIKLEEKKWAIKFLADNIGVLSIEAKQKLDIERRKMELAERQADTLDDDIEYTVEGGTDENKEED